MVQTCTMLCGGDEKMLKRSGITWPQWGRNMWSTIQKSMCLMRSKSRPGMSSEQDQSLTWSLDTLEKTVSKSWSSFSFMRATHVEVEEKWKTKPRICFENTADCSHILCPLGCVQSPLMLPLTCGYQRLTAPKLSFTGPLWTWTLSRESSRSIE